MPADLRTLARPIGPDITITGASLSAAAATHVLSQTVATIPTAAGTIEVLFIAPFAGTVTAIKTVFKEALLANNTNFLSVRAVNLGQAGAGTTDLLLATDVNSTKVTLGTALAAYAMRDWALGASLAVAAGDVVAVRFTGNGTLANTLTEGRLQLHVLVAT